MLLQALVTHGGVEMGQGLYITWHNRDLFK
jgi:xanthine dehydrogenase molybdopterin-binding subunit B